MARIRVPKTRGGRSNRSGPACAPVLALSSKQVVHNWTMLVQIQSGVLSIFMETVAQLAECLAVDEKVAGSWPASLPFIRMHVSNRRPLDMVSRIRCLRLQYKPARPFY